jgi:hypothetical protein
MMEDLWIIAKKTHGWVRWKDDSPIEIAKFAMYGLCFFVHVVKYTIAITSCKNFHHSRKNNYVIIHQWMQSKLY